MAGRRRSCTRRRSASPRRAWRCRWRHALRPCRHALVCVWYDASADEARAAVDAIHADIAALDIAHAGSGSGTGRLSVSIGLHVLVPQPGQSRADALYQADQALYAAKAAGRNTTVVSGRDGRRN